MTSSATISCESRPRSVPPLSADERGELEMYREWSAKVADVCERAAKGDLEARLPGSQVNGRVGAMVRGINRLLRIMWITKPIPRLRFSGGVFSAISERSLE